MVTTSISKEQLRGVANSYCTALSESDANTTPLFTRDGKWVSGRSWSSGYSIGVLTLLSSLLNDSALIEKVEPHLEKFEDFLSEERFQDVGFLWRSAFATLFDQTGELRFLEQAIIAAEYILNCTSSEGWMYVNWKGNGDHLGVDQFMNLELLLWVFSKTAEEKYAICAHKAARFGAKRLIQPNGASLEYVRLSEFGECIEDIWGNCGIAGAVWARGQAWAIRGTLQTGITFQDADLIDHGLKMLEFIAAYYRQVGKLTAVLHDPQFSLQDSSAAIAILDLTDWCLKSNKLEVVERERISKAHSVISKLIKNSGCIVCKGPGLVSNASMPLRLIDKPGEFSAWGDYFLLSALVRT